MSKLIYPRWMLACLVLVTITTAQAQTKRDLPIPVIELSGSGAAIGATHAETLGDAIRDLRDNYLMVFVGNDSRRAVALGAARIFEAHLRPEHREEVRALAAAGELDHAEMLLAQCFLDLSPMAACSTVTLPASASPDGIARFGRNLDFPSLNVADKHTVLMIYRPEGKHAFAAVGWPAMIGVLSGMNEHGLTLANMEVSRRPRMPQAMPYTLLYRTVLEECRTIDEAVELLKRSPRQTANNLMLMDASGERAVVELSPESVKVRRGEEGLALISTNHQRDQDTGTLGRCRRYDALQTLSATQFGEIGVSQIELMLDRVSQGNMTLQAMIFEPGTRTLYLASGANATKRTYHHIDLNEYFK